MKKAWVLGAVIMLGSAGMGGALLLEPAAPDPRVLAARKYFGDVTLVDQHGQRHRLYSDLLEGRVVVIHAFFTSCPHVCPTMSRKLLEVQEALGERVGRDIRFLSVSVDPTTDTPGKLRDYAHRFDAGEGWMFLTGEKQDVELALRKLGQYVDEPNNHTNILLVGNERTGLWKKAMGLARTEELVHLIRGVLDDG
ncbi:MAG: SCO family protein [Myxococcota bacterium]